MLPQGSDIPKDRTRTRRLRPGRRGRGGARRAGRGAHGGGVGVERGRLGVARSRAGRRSRARSRAGPRPGRRRATCRAARNTSQLARRPLRPVEVLGHEVLAEADRRRLQHPAALEARRVLLAGLDPRRASRPSARASRTRRHFASCTVPWISTIQLGRRARPRGAARRCSGSRACAARPSARARRPRRARRSAAPCQISLSQPVLPRAACAPRGRTRSAASVAVFSAAGFFVHTPCGPRKSGMPDSVEIPAPVRITIAPRVAQPRGDGVERLVVGHQGERTGLLTRRPLLVSVRVSVALATRSRTETSAECGEGTGEGDVSRAAGRREHVTLTRI